MPRMDLGSNQREYAIHALKQMQKRDYAEIYFNLEMAKAEDSVRDFSFGRMMLSIPEDHRRILALIFPAIDSEDGIEKTKAWKKLMKNDLTLPYRINPKETGNARSSMYGSKHPKRLSS